MQQTAFTFNTPRKEYAEETFIRSPSNQQAWAWIQKWPDTLVQEQGLVSLPFSHAIIIYGPQSAGKTHLASLWQTKNSALKLKWPDISSENVRQILQENKKLILEDVHTLRDETALFHCFNVVKEHNAYLLMTSRYSPASIAFTLKDLQSRMNAIPAIAIEPPDDELFYELFKRHFEQRQLQVKDDVIEYLIRRTERSCLAAEQLAGRIDEMALSAGKNITIPFVKTII